MRPVYIATMLIGSLLAGAPVPAQTSSQQMPAHQGAPPSPALVTACVDAQQQVAALAGQINGRLEDARQTNSLQEMRAALADLQAALVVIQTRAGQCSPMNAVAPSNEMPGMDHSKPAMSATPVTTPATGAKPSAKPADPMAGMDHSKMPKSGTQGKPGDEHGAASKGDPKLPVTMAERVADPACPDNVGRADAPRATYQRRVYYFCSVADRDAFKKDPAGYLKRRPR